MDETEKTTTHSLKRLAQAVGVDRGACHHTPVMPPGMGLCATSRILRTVNRVVLGKPVKTANPGSILLVRQGMIGDVIQTTALVEDLRSSFPQAHIAYMTGSSGNIVLRDNPNITEVIPYLGMPNRRITTAFLDAVKRLRQHHFDLGISLNNGSWDALLLQLAGVRWSMAFVEPGREFLADEPIVWIEEELRSRQDRFDEILRRLSIEPKCRKYTLSDPAEITEVVQGILAEADQMKLVAVAPGGASHPPGAEVYRRWLPQRFAAVIDALLADQSIFAVLIGDIHDNPVVANVLSLVSPDRRERVRNLSGQTTIGDLVHLLRHCSLLITNDSAPVWIAASVNCPMVVIFGCNHPVINRPLADSYRAVSARLTCHPCYRGDRIPSCPIPAPCVDSVTVEQVVSAVHELLP